MTLPIYPGSGMLPGLAYSSKWSPVFFNHNAVGAAGGEYDIAVTPYPLHDFELTYRVLRDGPGFGSLSSGLEFRTMMGFHLAMAGARGRFLYRNPDDNQVYQNAIGTGDGVTTRFVLTRTYGANGYVATEPVGQVNVAAGVNVYLGGSPAPIGAALYTIDTGTPGLNAIVFTTAPGAGQAIAVDMGYWYYCKLAKDTNSFEKFMSRMWTVSKVQLHSCRAGA